MRDGVDQVGAHLAELTGWLDGRPVGSDANRAAEAYIAGVLADAGFEVERQPFDCIEWQLEDAGLWLGDQSLPVIANPYSPSCDVTAPFVAVASLEQLERAEFAGRVVVLHGELTQSALFPRNYPFFTVEAHQRIVDLLEQKRAAAVVCVSAAEADPAPLIEDGEFRLPSVTTPAGAGAALLASSEPVTVRVSSTAHAGRAANVIGRRAVPDRSKIVICAHFDTKPGTPGALDNAAGVAATLAMARRLAAAKLATNLEIVAFNGEDHYAAPGEVAYINNCGSEFGRIALVVNIDGVGLKEQPSTVAFFNCPEAWTERARAAMAQWAGIEESTPWPEGDHSIFAMQNVPCLALTSGGIHALIDEIIHTPNDTLDLVSPEQIAVVIDFLISLLTQIGPPRTWGAKGEI